MLRAIDLLRDRLPNLRVRFVGSGTFLPMCKAFVVEHGLTLRVTFEPEGDHTLLPDFYRSLDLFVLPSYFEGFGCVFTEAWSCGTPFITCKGQGMDDLIPESERVLWLCNPMDPQDLAEKIAGFFQKRPVQHLSAPVDIDHLITAFVKDLEMRRQEALESAFLR